MKTLKFDLMKPIGGGNERFIATMRYEYPPVFKFDFKAFYEWIINKRPSLKGQPFNVYTDDEVIKVLHFNQSINQIIQFSPDYRQEIFEWIYESPISTWRDRLFCARLSLDFYREYYAWLISESNSSNDENVHKGADSPNM